MARAAVTTNLLLTIVAAAVEEELVFAELELELELAFVLGVVVTFEGLVLGVLRKTLEAEEAVLQFALWLGLKATLMADLVRDALA